MTMPPGLVTLLAQYDHACERVLRRLVGPEVDSGDGCLVEVPSMTEAEYLWGQHWTRGRSAARPTTQA